MSLTKEDLEQVRDVVVGAIEALVLPRFDEHDKRFEALEADVAAIKEDVRILKEDVRVLKIEMREVKEDIRTLQGDMREVKESLHRLDGRVEALEADVKELYTMIAATSKHGSGATKLATLSIEQKVLQMYEDFQLLAKEAGVTLPS